MTPNRAQGHLARVIDNDIRALEGCENEELCRLFRIVTRHEACDASEDLLNALAARAAAFDAEAGREAAEAVADCVRRVNKLIRPTKCPPEGVFEAREGGGVGLTRPGIRSSGEDLVVQSKPW